MHIFQLLKPLLRQWSFFALRFSCCAVFIELFTYALHSEVPENRVIRLHNITQINRRQHITERPFHMIYTIAVIPFVFFSSLWISTCLYAFIKLKQQIQRRHRQRCRFRCHHHNHISIFRTHLKRYIQKCHGFRWNGKWFLCYKLDNYDLGRLCIGFV